MYKKRCLLIILSGIVFLLGFLIARHTKEAPRGLSQNKVAEKDYAHVGTKIRKSKVCSETTPKVGELQFNGKSLRIGMSKEEVRREVGNLIKSETEKRIYFQAKPFGIMAKIWCNFSYSVDFLSTILCSFLPGVYSPAEFRNKLEGALNRLIEIYGKPTEQRGSFGMPEVAWYRGVQGTWKEMKMNLPTYLLWELEDGSKIEYWYRDLMGPEYTLRFTGRPSDYLKCIPQQSFMIKWKQYKEERVKERIKYLEGLRERNYKVFLLELQITERISWQSEILDYFKDDVKKLKEKQ